MKMTQEQFENEQMESFNRMRSNIQARIVELEGAVEGTGEGFQDASDPALRK